MIQINREAGRELRNQQKAEALRIQLGAVLLSERLLKEIPKETLEGIEAAVNNARTGLNEITIEDLKYWERQLDLNPQIKWR